MPPPTLPPQHFEFSRLRKVSASLLACWLCLALCGCLPILHEVEHSADKFSNWASRKSQKPRELSTATWELLRYWDLDHQYVLAPGHVLVQGKQLFHDRPDREWACALAELSYLEGEKAECRGETVQAEHFLDTTSYAYYFLFADNTPLNAFDRRNSFACTLYNSGLEKCLAFALKRGGLDPTGAMALHPSDKRLMADAARHGFMWNPQEFNEILLAKQFADPEHIRRQRLYGMGVPLLGVRHQQDKIDKRERFLVKRHPFAITAFFRPNLSRLSPQLKCEPTSPTDQQVSQQTGAVSGCGTLELYNPLRVSEIIVAEREVPLQADFSAQMLYVLQGEGRKTIELSGFFEPEKAQKYAGLYMAEPYQADKIPVVFVHGLLSGPVTWSEMFEELRLDPVLRERYQFWFFLYPTGSAFLDSARLLRNQLQEVVATFGDEHSEVHRMVLVGHSMGGLISKLQVTESQDKLWSLVSQVPLEQVKTDEQSREILRQTFFFSPQPAVKQVVFIGTPHHGSELSLAPIGRFGAWLVHAPKAIERIYQQLQRDNPGVINARFRKGVPTSVELLAENNPILQAMFQLPFERPLQLHSVVGTLNDNVLGKGALASFLTGRNQPPGDGVVAISSAHLDNVDSEYLVPATHEKVHRHPLTVREVRRILLEHLHWMENAYPIQTVRETFQDPPPVRLDRRRAQLPAVP